MGLNCENLDYTIGNRLLFEQLSADFPHAKLTGVIGPNGAGKSTLLSILAGIRKRQSGQVILDGQLIDNVALNWRAKRLAYLPQQNHVYAELRVIDLVLLGRAPHRYLSVLWKQEDYQIAEDSLETVGLRGDKYGRRYLHSLSGGERQRVMLARMLATQADIFLLDEPTTALDIHNSLAFLELCRSLCSDSRSKARTIVLSLHQLELAYRYCDFTLLLGLQDAPHYLYGPTVEVASVENLSRVFKVKAKKTKQNIFFYL